MSRILFSPIGGSDPIRNLHDGSMLHICRNYRPNKVVLYLSAEMCVHHKNDNRYLYCLNKLGELLNHHFEVEIMERPELKEAQNYECFYDDFRSCILEIESKMAEEDELFLNIASGTPAMKSALSMLAVLSERPLKTIQTFTPLKHINTTDENIVRYEVEAQWECNEDNTEKSENRCKEVSFVNLTKLLRLDIIKKHLSVYDYSAAYQVAVGMGKFLPERVLLLLEQAKERLMLNTVRVNVLAKQTGYQPMPVKREEDCKLVEYILLLQIKLFRAEYDDFIRAITPAVVILFERALEKQCHIDLNSFCTEVNGERRWDRKKLEGTEVLDSLNRKYGEFKFGSVYSSHLKELLSEFSNNSKLNRIVENLRNAEEKARNKAAHTIVSITKEQVGNWTGSEPKDIMEQIKTLVKYVIPDISEDVWRSYDGMNDRIYKELEQGV